MRNKHGALLRGLLRCASCNCSMTHSFSNKGQKRYRYYVCTNAQRRGRDVCPAPSLPAGEIEKFVVDQIRGIGRDPALVAATLAHTRRQAEEGITALEREKDALDRQRRGDGAELRRLAGAPGDQTDRLAEVLERMGQAERRLTEIADEIAALSATVIDEDEVATALAEFDGVWEALVPREQARILELLIERIDHDGESGDVAITFRPAGIKALAAEFEYEEHAA